MQLRGGLGIREHTHYERHDPRVDLGDVPVFYHSMDPTEVRDAIAAFDTDGLRDLKLPYTRCAFITRVPKKDDPTNTGRYYVVVAEQEGEEILFFGFVRPDNLSHWARQNWQVHYRDGDFDVAFEQGMAGADFVERYLEAVGHRVLYLLIIIHRITTARQGTVTSTDGGRESQANDVRRQNLGLPPVPKIRVLDFDKAVAKPSLTQGGGTPKRPHFRRGTWRNYSSGRRVWIQPIAVHGGGDNPPPWYEVR